MRATLLPLSLLLLLAACGGSSSQATGGAGGEATSTTTTTATDTGGSGGGTTTTTTPTPDPNGPWAFAPATVDNLPAVWGGMVAQESPTVAYLAGGVAGKTGPVTGKLFRVEQGATGVTATEVSSGLTPRYCGCAMVDASRGEVVVIGGRNGSFVEKATAEIVNVTTGAAAPLDSGGAADHPVGCHAVFLADRDEGYVFGGVGQAVGFGSDTWRYSPSDHSFTKLPSGAAPPARYDGVLRYPAPGGPMWLVGGMGVSGGKPVFYPDVWKLDPASGAWTEVPASGALPPGRRLPWVAFSADQGSLVMGFGSDSPMGSTLLGDLWRLDVAAGTWAEVPRTADPQPEARGFSNWLPGPEGSVGLLSGGIDEVGLAKEAWVIQSPVTTTVWR